MKNDEIKPNRLFNIYGENRGTGFAGNVWDREALSPTITTCEGGCREPMILDDYEPTKGIDFMYNPYNNTEITDVAPAQTTCCGSITSSSAVLIGSGSREPLVYDEQNGYIRQDGTVGTITTDGSSPKHNNRIIETEPINAENDGTCRTIKAQYQNTSMANFEEKSTFEATGVRNGFRIRKLTPKECWRLMDFDDEDFEKAQKVNSNAQLYKQAGNSIVVSCLYHIFKELL